jgi:hypothetical protein
MGSKKADLQGCICMSRDKKWVHGWCIEHKVCRTTWPPSDAVPTTNPSASLHRFGCSSEGQVFFRVDDEYRNPDLREEVI